MKNRIRKNKKIILSMLFAAMFNLTLFFPKEIIAQYSPISLEVKREQATLIVEGKVIKQETLREDRQVFTKNTLEVIQLIKGNLENSKYVTIITYGGTIDGRKYASEHLPELNTGIHGYFFLMPTSEGMFSNLPLNNCFEIYGGVQGIYRYNHDFSRTISSVHDQYDDVELFYHDIGIPAYRGYQGTTKTQNLSERNDDPCIVYNLREVPQSIADTSDINRDNTIQVDLYIKVTSGAFKLFNANLETYYNTNIFGSNMVASAKITGTKSTNFNPNYTLTLADEASDKISINLTGNSSVASTLNNIDTIFKHIARFTLSIQGWDGKSLFEYDELGPNLNTYSEEGTNVIRGFDCEELTVGAACNLEITSISNIAAAGVGDITNDGVLEIIGTNLIHDSVEPSDGWCGLPNKEHRVKFININDNWVSPFEGNYLEWTSTKIRVAVPTFGYDGNSFDHTSFALGQYAGTGNVRVCINDALFYCSCYATSKSDDNNNDGKLYVPYSAKSKDREMESGYNPETDCNISRFARYSTEFTSQWFFFNISNLPLPAQQAFIRALNSWRCAIDINFGIADFDGSIPVSITSLNNGLDAFTGNTTVNCPSDNQKMFWAIDMKFESNRIWHFDENTIPPEGHIDFESAALHEIGHAIGLIHTNNEENVMFDVLKAGTNKRNLTADDLAGGNFCQDRSLIDLPSVCGFELIDLVENCNIPLSMKETKDEPLIKIFPNPTAGELNINTNSIIYNIEIIGADGSLLKSYKRLKGQYKLNVSDLLSGIYFIEITSDKKSYISKFVKL